MAIKEAEHEIVTFIYNTFKDKLWYTCIHLRIITLIVFLRKYFLISIPLLNGISIYYRERVLKFIK